MNDLTKSELTALAAKCEADPARSSQAVASMLYSILGALAEGSEEALCRRVAQWSEGQIRRLTASRN